MQLHLKREEQKRGMIRKKLYYVLHARIETTPEEAEVIKKAGIGDRVMLTHYDDVLNDEREKTVDNFTYKTGAVFGSNQLDQIASWEAEIKSAASALKELVGEHLEGGGEREEVIDL